MTPRSLTLGVAIILLSCVRRPEPFSTSSENDDSIIFPLSVGQDLVKVEAQKSTYMLDGEVLRALMIVANDLFPRTPGASNLPCWARPEAHTYRFTRRDNIIFVYVDEDLAYCGREFPALDSGAKYAISTEGRILRRVIGSEPDHGIWRLKMPDGGTVTVVAEPGVVPDLKTLETPDGGILKVVTDPVNMPGVLVYERPEGGSQPVETEPGAYSLPPLDAGYKWEWRDRKLMAVPEAAPASNLDGGSPDAGWDGGTPGS